MPSGGLAAQHRDVRRPSATGGRPPGRRRRWRSRKRRSRLGTAVRVRAAQGTQEELLHRRIQRKALRGMHTRYSHDDKGQGDNNAPRAAVKGACMQTRPDRPETHQRARNVALLTLELHGTFIQRAGVDHGTAATREKGVAVPNLGEEDTQHSRSMLEERRCHGGWQYGHVLEAPPLTTPKTPRSHSSTGGRPWSHWHAPERRSAESADTGKEQACRCQQLLLLAGVEASATSSVVVWRARRRRSRRRR